MDSILISFISTHIDQYVIFHDGLGNIYLHFLKASHFLENISNMTSTSLYVAGTWKLENIFVVIYVHV